MVEVSYAWNRFRNRYSFLREIPEKVTNPFHWERAALRSDSNLHIHSWLVGEQVQERNGHLAARRRLAV
jgi:hypothetical protein